MFDVASDGITNCWPSLNQVNLGRAHLIQLKFMKVRSPWVKVCILKFARHEKHDNLRKTSHKFEHLGLGRATPCISLPSLNSHSAH